MRRSRTLLFALMLALVAVFALPMTASAGSSSGSDDFDCADFSSQQDAQATYLDQDGDPDGLDEDEDGSACEEFEYDETFSETEFVDSTVDEYPREGIASGGGSTANGGPSPLPLLLSAGIFALLAGGSWAVAVRRRLER